MAALERATARDRSDGSTGAGRYQELLTLAMELFRFLVIDPAPIPIIFEAIEALIADPDYTRGLQDRSATGTLPSHQPIGQPATVADIDRQEVAVRSDLTLAVVAVMRAAETLAADTDPRDPSLFRAHQALSSAIAKIRNQSAALMRLDAERAVLATGSTHVDAPPSHAPMADPITRTTASDPYIRSSPAAWTLSEESPAPRSVRDDDDWGL